MAYHSLIAAANSIALRRSNNKYSTECRNEFRYNANARMLELAYFLCGIIAVLGIHIKTKLVKAIYTVIHTYRYSMINVSKLNRQET
jgi:hypothetical protein